MKHDLPPLHALRAFEAAARHRSFTRGARELNVTQAAVSHQVRILEEWLGQKLFVRRPRALALTRAGEQYQRAVFEAFSQISLASQMARKREGRSQLHISVLPSLAARWSKSPERGRSIPGQVPCSRMRAC